MKHVYLSAILALFLFISNNKSQNPEWVNYTYGNFISGIAEEGDYLWVTTSGGLVKLDETTGKATFFNRANSGMLTNNLKQIIIDKYGNKWIGTEGGGLTKYNDSIWITYTTSNSGILNDYILSLAIDKYDNIWIGYEDGFSIFDGVNWTNFKRTNSDLPINRVKKIVIDKNNIKWIGTKNGLIKFDGKSWTLYNTANSGLPDNWVRALAIDSNSYIWIGTNAGLAKFNSTNWTIFNIENSGLPVNEVSAIAIDKYDNKWLGTAGGGLAVYREGGVILNAKDEEKELEKSNSLTISPNPVADKIQLTLDFDLSNNTNISIFDYLGKEWLSQVINSRRTELNCSSLPNGIYFCLVKSGSRTYTSKFVVLR